MASGLEPNWEWVQGEISQRPLASYEALLGMTIFYIVAICVISFFMRENRAKANQLIRQSQEIKKLELEIKKFEGENGSAPQTIKEKRDALQIMTKKHKEDEYEYKPINISWFTIPHNLVMCIYSLYTFVGVSIVMFQNLKKSNFMLNELFCDPTQRMKEGMDFWVYTFYLSKFVEYLDTVFLLLKAKSVVPPENSQYLLHIYHHAVTAAIVWVSLFYQLSVAWTGPWTNAGVHTLMYGYYFLAELNQIDRSLGGKFITPIQLIQFIFCIVAILIEIVQGSCGTHLGAFYFLFANYLIFFVFFVKIWFDKKKERQKPKGSTKKEE